MVCFVKQKTADDMRISYWSSDVCSSDLELRDLKRILEDPEGEVWPRFKLLHMPPEATPGTSAFICQHLTPELVWRPEWCVHPNGASGLIAMTSVVKDPSALAIPYAELFGFDRVRAGDGVVEVRSEGRRVGKVCVSTCRSRGAPQH